MRITRRAFLQNAAISTAALAAVWGASATIAEADPLGLPIGLQLYTVRNLLAKDFEGTLQKVAAAGYREVEAAGFYGKTAAQVKQALQSAGLRCPSAHYPLFELLQNTEAKIAYAHEIGLQYMICSFPAVKNPPRINVNSKNAGNQLDAMVAGMTLDDWKWNAEQLNRIGELTRKAGITMGYHNHDIEFRKYGATSAYDELLRVTDPHLVTMELDCGWVKVAGHDPVAFLKKYPARYSMLHVKDETVVSPPQTSMNPRGSSIELGRGQINYRRILTAAAATGHIRHYFVEQEEFPHLPVLKAIRADYEYLHHLQV